MQVIDCKISHDQIDRQCFMRSWSFVSSLGHIPTGQAQPRRLGFKPWYAEQGNIKSLE